MTETPETPDDFEPIGTATYSPEDNKLRLYAFSRLSKELYGRVKAAGFKWAPKQELFVAPMWTPQREDLLLELCGEIGDEDYSPEERAADRAERFGEYRDKRAAEAHGSADRFESGPSSFGHQNRARAERQAARHDRHRRCAVSRWGKAEYWQQRTAGVISNALYKSSPAVRRERILRLEAELRALQSRYTPNSDPPNTWEESGETYVMVGAKGRGAYPAKLRNLESIKAAYTRSEAHYRLRIDYERAMLGEEGGTAAECEMVAGGWLGTRQIQAVTKSLVTGRVVSVKVWGTTTRYTKESEYSQRETVPCLCSLNIERLGADVYRAPTAEELEQFNAETKARKKAAKATAPKLPPLINPSEDDALRLQLLWNSKAQQLFDAGKRTYQTWGDYEPVKIIKMTQAQYAALSKGAYARAETRPVCANGFHPGRHYGSWLGGESFKLRTGYSGNSFSHAPYRIIVLTDKPQKPLPLDWTAIESPEALQAVTT
jgi:hypothetical protein